MIKEIIYSLKRVYHFFKTGLLDGLKAEITYNFPAKKLTILTITGTDGKTTSSTMLYEVLKVANIKVALLSTVAAYLGDEKIDTGFHVTSPQPKDLQEFMRKMVDLGYTHLVLEVTSHGAYQYRTWGVTPTVAGVTNIAHEHLDYHLTYDKYLRAKSLILKKAPIVVLNADDQSYYKLADKIPVDRTVITYSANASLPKNVTSAIRKKFSELYNQQNARLVYAMAKAAHIDDKDFIKGIKKFAGIPGRMEKVDVKKPFEVIVDFAHTPQGLEAALSALKKKLSNKGRLIAVFGCAGLRDFKKRPIMGKIATEIADICIFTAEDPRTEDVWSIIRQMKEQLTTGHNRIISIADRREAIHFAINSVAKKSDIIGIFGKGHETSMCYGTTEYPWSDQDAVKVASLAKAGK
ncbi:MAG: Mur ligase family protein [Microgenomates group bacterium]